MANCGGGIKSLLWNSQQKESALPFLSHSAFLTEVQREFTVSTTNWTRKTYLFFATAPKRLFPKVAVSSTTLHSALCTLHSVHPPKQFTKSSSSPRENKQLLFLGPSTVVRRPSPFTKKNKDAVGFFLARVFLHHHLLVHVVVFYYPFGCNGPGEECPSSAFFWRWLHSTVWWRQSHAAQGWQVCSHLARSKNRSSIHPSLSTNFTFLNFLSFLKQV